MDAENDVTLKEHVRYRLDRIDERFADVARQRIEDRQLNDTRVLEHQAAHDREHQAAQKVAEKDDARLDLRFAQVNEFRGSLSDLSATMATRQYVDSRFESMMQRMEQADKNASERAVAVASSMETRIGGLERTLNLLAGKATGGKETIAYIFAGLGALATVVSLFLLFSGAR
jgi:hypothetical protein